MDKLRTVEILHPRIGATFLLIPLAIAIEMTLYVVMGLLMSTMRSTSPVLTIALIIGLIFLPALMTYFGTLIIWSPVVRWTPSRRIRTLAISVLFVLALATLGVLLFIWQSSPLSYTAPGLALLLACIAVVVLNLLWYTPPQARGDADGVICPTCGYDLRGQNSCRCPECGTEYKLGELMANRRHQRDGVSE